MKTPSLFKIPVLTFLLMVVATGPGFALQLNRPVSKEEAKELGVVIRSNQNGENGVKVWIEFEPKGKLKNFTHVDLKMTLGEKCLVATPLLATRPTPERVSAQFSADPEFLAVSVLTIVVQDGERTRIGYQFSVKDFLELE